MVSILAYPKPLVDRTKETVLTFVVPTKNGCDLNCSYCYIKQRKERSHANDLLGVSDYGNFIKGIISKRNVGCISIQGEEPLLAESLPYTNEILSVADQFNIPTAIVTNGTNLKNNLRLLNGYHCLEEITVSLDSFDETIHDKMRGVKGTFKRVINGLNDIQQYEKLNKIVSVASVLFPEKTERLKGMPKLLANLGTECWFITPALKIEEDKFGGPISSWKQLISDLEVLYDCSSEYNIKMIVEDEYNHFKNERENNPLQIPLRFRNLDHPKGILRLLPDGTCEVGYELLMTTNINSLRWIPYQEHPDNFYQRVMKINNTANIY